MRSHVFISYSRADGMQFALRLADALEAGPPHIPTWLDRREMRPGRWDAQLRQAVQACSCLLFVATPDSVEEASVCTAEWGAALDYKKPIVPLMLSMDTKLPFRIADRQGADFTGSFDQGLAQLRIFLEWQESPEGVLQALEDRLQDAERDLRRAAGDEVRAARAAAEAEELRRQVDRQRQVASNPEGAARQVERSIEQGLREERRPAPAPGTRFVNVPPEVAPAHFQDRVVETELMGRFLRDDALRMLTVVGRGGLGKTSMVCRLLKALEQGRLPDGGGAWRVDGIVYLGNTGSRPVTVSNLYHDLCRLLPSGTARHLEGVYRHGAASVQARITALLREFEQRRAVVLLDNLEDDISPGTLEICKPELDEALRTVLAAPGHRVKVIVTTRVVPPALARLRPERQWHIALDGGLPPAETEAVLRALDADGTLGVRDAPASLLRSAWERTAGNPAALERLISILRADRDTTLADLVSAVAGLLPEEVMQVLVGEAFARLERDAQQVMQALAVYAGPVPPAAVSYLLQPHAPGTLAGPVLKRLVNLRMARRASGEQRYYLHPVDRAYVFSRIPEGPAGEADAAAPTRGALLQRAAEFFRQARTPRESWRSIRDLAPVLAEIEMRYAAGDYDGAARVLQEIDYDYLLQWDHARELRDLAERLRGWLAGELLENNLGTLGAAYWGLARYGDAAAAYREAAALAGAAGRREEQGRWLGNLALCETLRGNHADALELARRAQAIALETEHGQRHAAWVDLEGTCLEGLGDLAGALACHERALALARALNDAEVEEESLGGVARVHALYGDVDRALQLHGEALELARGRGNRYGVAGGLATMAALREVVGATDAAIRDLQTGLEVAREIGNVGLEGAILCRLGEGFLSLGDFREAQAHLERGLTITGEVGDRETQTLVRAALATLHACEGRHPAALRQAGLAVDTALALRTPELLNRAHVAQALGLLLAGDARGARAAAETAVRHPNAETDDNAALLLGIAALVQGERDKACAGFAEAVEKAGRLLSANPRNYNALDSRCLALCGLAVCGEGDIRGALDAFYAARALTRGAGVLRQVRLLLDCIARVDAAGVLAAVAARVAEAATAAEQARTGE